MSMPISEVSGRLADRRPRPILDPLRWALIGPLLLLVVLSQGATGLWAQDVSGDEGIPLEPSGQRQGVRDLKGALLVAIETRDHGRATEALEAGANIGINIGKPSALATAALLNDMRMVLILLKAGAHPNSTDDSPLAEAIRSDNREMVDLFLQIGAEVPGQVTLQTLFESAQGGENAEWFYDVLLDRGGDPQLGLYSAVIHNRPKLAALSLQRGARLAGLPKGEELLRDVTAEELPKILHGLLQVAPRDEVVDYFFALATTTGDRLLVEALQEEGAEVELRYAEDAMAAGHRDLALHLVDVLGGATAVGQQAEVEGLPLLASHLEQVRSDRTEALIETVLTFGLPALLLLLGVPVLLRRSQRSPATFHKAVAEGQVAKVSRLLDRGADIDAVHGEVRPLHVAVAHGNLTVVRMLLSRGAGADRRAKDELGYMPLHVAASVGSTEIAEALLKSRCPVDGRASNGRTPLYVAASAGLRPMVEWLLEQGADLEKTVREGETLLMHAIAHRDVEAVSQLLAVGANPNPTMPSKPLHRVAISGQAGMARLLLEHGADVDAVDGNGATPLQIALQHHQVEVGEILRKAGARLT